MREPLSTPDAPRAIGPYSQGVRAGQMIFVSGQGPIDPATGSLIDGDIAEAFVNGRFAMACRIYDFPTGQTALFAEYGAVDFENIRVRALPAADAPGR